MLPGASVLPLLRRTEVMPSAVSCRICSRKFPFQSGKRVCSKECRNELHEKGKSVQDQQLNMLPLLSASPELARRFVGKPEDAELAFLIKTDAPPTAVSFRLGCFRDGPRPAKHPRVRWFPYLIFRNPPVYSLVEWEPVHVPFAANYAVAYFDDNCNLVCPPKFFVEVRKPNAVFNWSDGDTSLLIRPLR